MAAPQMAASTIIITTIKIMGTLLRLPSFLCRECTVTCTPCPESLLSQPSCCRYLGPDYGDLQRPAGEVALADLPRLAHESFPLCMLVRHTVCQVKLHILSACMGDSMTKTSSMCRSLYDCMWKPSKLKSYDSIAFYVLCQTHWLKACKSVSKLEYLQTCAWYMIRPSDPVSTNSMHSSQITS